MTLQNVSRTDLEKKKFGLKILVISHVLGCKRTGPKHVKEKFPKNEKELVSNPQFLADSVCGAGPCQ
jgi:hypothetical protein